MASPQKTDPPKDNPFSGFASLVSGEKKDNPFAAFSQNASGPLLFGQTSSSAPTFSFNASTFGSSGSAKKDDKKKDEDEDEDEEGDDGDDAAAAADESHAADFKPLVTLAPVEVKSMEEDEDIVFKSRSKLYIFIKEDVYGDEVRKNWWKERGLGEVKILKHRSTGECRLLMRQEKTLKLCMNHKISPKTELKPTAGSEGKSWTFPAVDFADGEAKTDLFALKLPSADIAEQFSAAFQEAKKANAKKQGSDAPVSPEKPVISQGVPPPPAPTAPSSASKPAVAAPSVVESAAKDLSKMNMQTNQPPALAGGYSKRSPDETEVKNVAKFAVEKIGQGDLVKIASVKSQVVAGMNYRMALHVKHSTGEVFSHVVTVYQPLPHTKEPLKLSDHVVTGKVA